MTKPLRRLAIHLGLTVTAVHLFSQLCAFSQSCAPLAPGLVAWWPGDGSTEDVIGQLHAVPLNGVAAVPGRVNQAYGFDGLDDGAVVPAASALDVGRALGFTLEAWINPSTVTRQSPILEWNSGTAYGVHFYHSVIPPGGNGPGCLFANLVDTLGVNHVVRSGAGAISVGEYQHVALTYDSISGHAILYLNGVLLADESLGTFVPQTSYNLLFGYRPSGFDGSPFYFSGGIDEISIYNRALLRSEIQAIYTAGGAGKCRPQSSASPEITQQPASTTVAAGGTVTLSVTATGAEPLRYQWYKNEALIFGATRSTLTLQNVQPSDGASYLVRVSNGVGSTLSQPAIITVTSSPNAAPTLADIPDQATDEDTVAAVTLQIGDAETPATSLQVAVSSSNPDLLPSERILVAGVGATRSATLAPIANASGSTTVTVTVTDRGGLAVTDTFILTVRPINDPPTISAIANQSGPVGSVFGPIAFTMSDVDNSAESLQVSVTSSKPELVPVSGISISGTGSARAVTIQPAPGQSGTATITLSVTDGQSVGNTSFQVAVGSSSARIVRVGDATGGAGADVVVPILISATGNENAIGFSLQYDPASLSTPRVKTSVAGAQLNTNTGQTGVGRIGIALALGAGQVLPAGNNTLVEVTFAVNGGAVSSIPVDFADQPIAKELIDASANALTATFQGGTITLKAGYEADVSPRPNGSNNGTVTISDWVQVGRFAAGLDRTSSPGEFQKADCAPRNSNGALALGNGAITISDWVQAGRYAAGLDPIQAAGGPSSPVGTSGLSTRAAKVGKLGPAPRILSVESAPLSLGQTGAITVSVQSEGDINALGFSLNFDPLQLRYAGANVASGLTGATLNLNTGAVDNGRIGLAVAMPSGQTVPAGKLSIVEVRFTALVQGPATAPLTFGDQPIAREIVSVAVDELTASYNDGGIALEGPAPTNTPPMISAIPDQTVTSGVPLQLTFDISDVETAADALQVKVEVSNTTLVPAKDTALSGAGGHRILQLVPAAGQTGSAVVTVIVTDAGALSARATFNLIVADNPFVTWQSRYFSAAELADAKVSGADADADLDGATNSQEFLAGTDPRDPNSVLSATIRAVPVVTWKSVPGTKYRVSRRATLGEGLWEALAPLVTATEATASFTDFGATDKAYYRIEVIP